MNNLLSEKLFKVLFSMALLFMTIKLGAAKYDEDGFEIVSNEPDSKVLSQINVSYQKNIEPIFSKKCLDCHGIGNKKPWYYALPGAKHLMQRDIREAKSHMDMSEGFPFKGHGTAKDDLEALERTTLENTMPPWQYILMHWNSKPTNDEKEIILKWIKQSQELLKGEENES